MGSRVLSYIGIPFALLVALVGAYLLLRSPAEAPTPPSLFEGFSESPAAAGTFGAGLPATPGTALSSTATPPPAGFLEYRSERYGFSFAYEEGAKVTEFDEGGGAMSITIEDEARGHALQIYVLPYNGASISEERFRKDLPSGVRTEEEMIRIYGVPAVAFKSEVSMLGPTREVWFLQDGYLYEISVPLSMEGWLQDLLPSFRFF